MTKTLAIGNFSDAEKQALEVAFQPIFVASPSAVSTLAPAQKEAITCIAFKGHSSLNAEIFDILPQLGLIANFGVGYDAIDVTAATARDIRVTNTPDVLNDDVADLAVALILMQARKLEQASQWARTGRWASSGEFPLNRKVSGSRVGILGLGRIGQEIAARLTAFKCEIHYWSRTDKSLPGYTFHDSPAALADAVDTLVVAVVGGSETQGMVDSEVIAALGPSGLLVNISRGSTVDEPALLDALEAGTLGGAALDVFLNEPNIDPRFFALENVVIQPHQGSGTVETRADMAQLQRDNIAAFLVGAPLLTAVN